MSSVSAVVLAQPPRRLLASAGPFEVRIAQHPREVEQALALRYQVFATELGAQIEDHDGLDVDRFDVWCRHLVVVERHSDTVIGTYRVLLPEQACEAGGYYAEQEFDLSALGAMRNEMVEAGRACIAAEHRNGVVLMLLWKALRIYVLSLGHRYLIGCCSVDARDDGRAAAALYRQLSTDHLADGVTVRPRVPLHLASEASAALKSDIPVPPLLKGYLKAGARLLGEPHLDAAFRCADFPILLDLHAMAPRLSARLAASTREPRLAPSPVPGIASASTTR